MRLAKLLTEHGLARTGGEASRLIKQGAIRVGGCNPSCSFFNTGTCSCKQWVKIMDPTEEITEGLVVKVGTGNWRCISALEGKGFDQLPGVCRS